LAVSVHEVQAQFVRAFVLVAERRAEGDGALGMNRRELRRVNGVKRAQQVEFAVLIGRGIAQNGYLKIHPYGMKSWISGNGTQKFAESRSRNNSVNRSKRRKRRD
jgi:hypothetical protein